MTFKQGTIKWFNNKKGFGVIDCNNKEYFIHYTSIKSNNKILNENDKVSFQEFNDNGKLCGINVTVKNKFLKINKRKKNTENFKPSHKPPDLRVLVGSNCKYYQRIVQSNDVIIIPNLFNDMYDKLLYEIKKTGHDNIFKLWHGDTHFIADDHLNFKKDCPLFNKLLTRIKEYFKMEIRATRFNWYKNSKHWKPFHHDAAAIKPHIAKIQNLTVGISFGAEREIAFEHSKKKTVVSFPLPNGTVYGFGKNVNITWKHGIPQIPPSKKHNKGRISIIVWGENEQI